MSIFFGNHFLLSTSATTQYLSINPLSTMVNKKTELNSTILRVRIATILSIIALIFTIVALSTPLWVSGRSVPIVATSKTPAAEVDYNGGIWEECVQIVTVVHSNPTS